MLVDPAELQAYASRVQAPLKKLCYLGSFASAHEECDTAQHCIPETARLPLARYLYLEGCNLIEELVD